ncbi:MAG TPA: penicillin-binding protein 1C [Longimicrobiales bacterium]|nr:penicillin-binding protein 1C [Longimicrobiales bacterium]
MPGRWLLIGAALAAAALVLGAAWIAWPLPQDLVAPMPVPSLVLQDRHGSVLRATRSPEGSRGGWVPLADIDPELLQAFIAAEDARFFQHGGIDLRALLRAARDNVRQRRVVSGASTITMQTARLLRPPRTRGVSGKLQQAAWALRLEAQLDKPAILERYLNRIPLGQGAVGVAAGAALYFGASPADLSLGQAALLAGLARAPSRDNPLVAPEQARKRRDAVLERMAARGHAHADDIRRAQLEPITFRPPEGAFRAPHFTTRVLTWLAAGAGANATGTRRTTLDLDLQQAVEAEVRHTVRTLSDRGARHAAVVVLENASGAVLAWVGSPDFFAAAGGQVDMVTSPRQPGSSLKPFLYGLAFEHGYSAATVLPDVPRTFPTAAGGYRPQNYDRRFRGPVRIREALGSSYNVPAVDLTERLGTGALLAVLRNAGFASLDRSAEHYGLGLALGNGEVTLLELANGYRGIANGGVHTPVAWLLEDEDHARMQWNASRTDRRERRTEGHRRFLSPGAAVLLLDILSDPVARIPGFGIETALDFPFAVAAKTGTSRHFTDNWAVAVAGRFTVAVWVGNFSGQPMRAVSGISGAGPLLHRVVLETARRYSPGILPSPEAVGAVQTPVCRLSGLAPQSDCQTVIEWFLPGTEPTRVDDWERDGRVLLPDEYAEWSASYTSRPLSVSTSPGPNVEPGRILSPVDGDEYQLPPGVDPRYATLALIASGGSGADQVRWYADGRELSSSRWQLQPGSHVITARWPSGAEQSVRVRVH